MLDSQTHIFYKLSVEEALKSLDSDISGISESEAESRQKKYGLNELTEKKHITPLEIFINQFKSVLILILIVAAGISGFILHEYTDMAVILVIVILNSIIASRARCVGVVSFCYARAYDIY